MGSFRNATAAELVRSGQASARISCDITDGSRQLAVALAINEGKRTYILNGKHRRPKDLRGILPSVAFTPDDLDLAKGSDRNRRHELDALGSQVNANYYQLVRDYEKVLRHKNRLLQDDSPAPLLEATNELFAKVGDQLTGYRRALFERLVPKVAAHYANISGGREKLTAEYALSTGREGALIDALECRFAEERSRKRALVGPHLDKVRFLLDGLDSTKFASQGQQRSIVLAVKLAEAELIEEMLDQLPVLLLDDVMSELDAGRRSALVGTLLEGKQAFITTANIDYFDKAMLERARLVEL